MTKNLKKELLELSKTAPRVDLDKNICDFCGEYNCLEQCADPRDVELAEAVVYAELEVVRAITKLRDLKPDHALVRAYQVFLDVQVEADRQAGDQLPLF